MQVFYYIIVPHLFLSLLYIAKFYTLLIILKTYEAAELADVS
jgi:hypothetical protein